MDNKKEGIKLIDKLYKDLYKDPSVIHHGTDNIYGKFNNIESYIDKLETVHKKVAETGRHIDYLKKCYYDKYVIKREDIPESYYNMQVQIALERGYGHINLTEQMKKELQDEVIENQKARIDTWLDYFLSEDSNVYPFWVKYWAFQGMLKLGRYDKEKGVFYKRTKETVEPFVDLNSEALSMSMDLIIKMLNKENIEDKELDVLANSGSFQKIYAYILTKILNNNENITKRNIGRWVKYNRGSDHMILVKSLQGYNTGWCTAGESTAKTQLEAGDFYVYYTLDENNEYKVPRVAIRMEGNRIGEIRGVAYKQNLESEMEKVVEDKIKDFPDREEYNKKVNDMKILTHIYDKHKSNQELTKEELRFLYEIDSEIKGFGYQKDPRIEEIINLRNFKKDLSLVFDCREDQIVQNKSEIKEDTIYYKGDICLIKLKSAKGLVLPQNIGGWLNLSSLTSAKGLVLPQSIGGNLDLRGLTSAEGLVLPQSIGGILDLSGLRSAEGLVLPQSIGGSLFLSGLRSEKGLVLPQSLGGLLDLRGLRSVEDLVLPENLNYNIYLSGFTITPQNVDEYRNNKKIH